MSGRETVSAAEIAQAIARSRERLGHSLATLDREYALRHLVVRGARMLHSGEWRHTSVSAAIRRDMLPLSLVGLGLAWLTLVERRDGAQVARRLIERLAHLQQLARELIAFAAVSATAPVPPSDSGSAASAPPNQASAPMTAPDRRRDAL